MPNNPPYEEGDCLDLDKCGMALGLKIGYVYDSDQDGVFATEIYVEGSPHDLKDELERNNPKLYAAINQEIFETLQRRAES